LAVEVAALMELMLVVAQRHRTRALGVALVVDKAVLLVVMAVEVVATVRVTYFPPLLLTHTQ
jgi:hypothetical protein